VPNCDEENFSLITGLDRPVGMCFDNNNEFLYVVNPTFGDRGYICKFSIDWDDDDDNFMLKNTLWSIKERAPTAAL
jgi:hypothetical protein